MICGEVNDWQQGGSPSRIYILYRLVPVLIATEEFGASEASASRSLVTSDSLYSCLSLSRAVPKKLRMAGMPGGAFKRKPSVSKTPTFNLSRRVVTAVRALVNSYSIDV